MGKKRLWPFVFYLRRCSSNWEQLDGQVVWYENVRDNDNVKFVVCRKLIWPWQDIRREFDPECGGQWIHHECMHKAAQSLWGKEWKEWINCEHRERA